MYSKAYKKRLLRWFSYLCHIINIRDKHMVCPKGLQARRQKKALDSWSSSRGLQRPGMKYEALYLPCQMTMEDDDKEGWLRALNTSAPQPRMKRILEVSSRCWRLIASSTTGTRLSLELSLMEEATQRRPTPLLRWEGKRLTYYLRPLGQLNCWQMNGVKQKIFNLRQP